MIRLLGLVIAIGLADSINPSTIAPALYLALGERPKAQVAKFTIAVFVVYLAGGALTTLGPGEIIRSVIPDVDIHHTVRYIAELVAGVLLVGAVAILFGATGLASGVPGRTGSFFRRVRRVLHHLRP